MRYLKQYYDAIKNGDIIVGHELFLLLERLIRELNESDKWYIDSVDVDKRISFIETFIKHTKSPFYGKPFILELWQKAFIEAVFGYKNKKTRLRRFAKVILLIARKNGKSTLCSAIAITELFIGNGGSGICISSNDDKQANIIFQEIKKMLFISKTLGNKKRTHVNLSGVYNLKNLSEVFKLSEKTENKEGRNIDLGILDESHEMEDNVIAKSIEQSQSTKEEPLFINITTEGFVADGYLDKELVYAREVNNGEHTDDTLLAWLYTQDNDQEIWTNPESHYKANPGLGTIKQLSYIEKELNKARKSTADRVFTLSKDFNIKQNSANAWLLEEDIVNEEEFNIEDFRNARGIGAIDLAETTDLCSAKLLLIRPSDRKKCILSMYFIPEAKTSIKSDTNPEKVDYLDYAKQKLVVISDGNENDFNKVVDWYWQLYKNYGIKVYKGIYDPWKSEKIIPKLEETFGSGIWEKVIQSFNSFSNPMTMVEVDLKSKNIIYNNNPLDKMCLRNTSTEVNKYGQQRPIKSVSYKRIDGSLTLIMCYVGYENYKNDIYKLNKIEVR